MSAISFNTWIQTHQVPLIDTDSPGWKKVNCSLKGKSYSYLVNMGTGDLFINHSDITLFRISNLLIIARPLATLFQIAYHLSLPISIPYAIAATPIKKGESQMKKYSISILKSLMDIIRTPIYGIVMTVMHVAHSTLYFIAPQKLNDMRILIGKVELSLAWGCKENCLVKCFQPLDNLMKIERRHIKQKGIDYPEDKIQIGLANLAYSIETKKRS